MYGTWIKEESMYKVDVQSQTSKGVLKNRCPKPSGKFSEEHPSLKEMLVLVSAAEIFLGMFRQFSEKYLWESVQRAASRCTNRYILYIYL